MPAARQVKHAATVLLTLAIGAAGGGLFAWLGLPAAWLSGAMVAVAVAALAGVTARVPEHLRNAAFVLIGVSMGASVTPEMVEQLAAWSLSLGLLALSVVVTMLAGAAYLERVHGWDPVTARFSAVPGAMASVMILAGVSSADVPRVALAQSLRVFALVTVMPPVISFFSGASSLPAAAAVETTGTAIEVVAMLGASAVSAAFFQLLRVPGGVLLGAMLASALLHGTGLVAGRPPPGVLIVGFVATGAVIGARFRGTSLAVLRATVRGALESVFLALALSAGFAALGTYWLDLPFSQLWLAYAPGGVEAMAIMAFTLGFDPAFVGGHHVLRLIGLNLLSAWWRPARTGARHGAATRPSAAASRRSSSAERH
jgi:uncharacterized protein